MESSDNLLNKFQTNDEMTNLELPESSINGCENDNHTETNLQKNIDHESKSSCCTNCRNEIQALKLTVQDQSKKIEELTEKLHWLEKLYLSPAHDSSDDEKTERRAASDTALAFLKLAQHEIELLCKTDQSNSNRKKLGRARKQVTTEISEEEKKLNELQILLSQHMYGDDVFKFFRYFHPNPEAHVSDFLRSFTAYEQFNQAFAELRKLGNSNFNPKAIHTCLIKIRCKKYADLIEDLVVGTTEPAMPTTTQNGFNHAASTSSSSLTTQLQLQDNEHCDLLPDSIALAS